MFNTEFKKHTIKDTGFQTIITTSNPIICFSDIHGDIDALIVCLRDCGNVIQKKKGFHYDDNKRDPDLEKFLPYDLNNTTEYIDDLNYEWCGNGTHVVIIGDILDPVRGDNTEHIYLQTEIKILRFLNKIASYANKVGGKIIKLCGNHELGNFIHSGVNIKNYMSDSDKENKNYYQGYSRYNYFKLGNPGFKLFQEGGVGIGILINNNFFVHGGLTSTYNIDNFISINKLINNDWMEETKKYDDAKQLINPNNASNMTVKEFIKEKEFISRYEQKQQTLINLSKLIDSPLWTREFNYSNKQIPIFIEKVETPDIPIITNVYNYFAKLFTKKQESKIDLKKPDNILDNYFNILFRNKSKEYNDKYNIDDYRLIIGHSGQNGSLLEYDNATFSCNDSSNKKIVKYNNKEVYIGKGDFTNNILFGISVACIEDLKDSGLKNPRLIRVDYNISRGFDILKNSLIKYCNNKELLQNNLKNIIKILYESRTPQICIIEDKHKLYIVKSKLKNTKINLPRQNFSGIDKNNKSKIYDIIIDFAKTFPNCNITKERIDEMLGEEPIDSAYYDKYLKYKNKYLKLKN
jgi:hypothetical protein